MGTRLCTFPWPSGATVGAERSGPSRQPGSSALVEKFRFFDLNVYPLADVQGAVAEVKREGLIKSTGRIYRQDYVVFLRAVDGKIAFLRE